MPTDSATLVSVIIPCYRQARYLDEAIRSVLAQTYRHFEIIVVDDGSPDDTAEVAARYAGVRCIRRQHLGLPAARNAGLHASGGEYAVFLDADDRLVPDALETGVDSLLSAPGCAFVYGLCEFIDYRGAPVRTPPHAPVRENHYRALFERNYILTPGAVMFRRSALSSVEGFDESFTGGCEDIDLYLRVTKRWPIQCHGRVVLQYRKHRASMSAKRIMMMRASNDLFRKHRREVRGDAELEELCRDKILPRHRLVLRHPTVARVIAAVRVRTRLRTVKSYLQRNRQMG